MRLQKRDGEMVEAFCAGFTDFLNDEFAEDFVKKGDFAWHRLIRFYSGGDSHSIQLFGYQFEKFLISFKEIHYLT
ncbi:hypothetical protein [Mucilaginibacter gotjawali]|uniref:Uncharacterized protein n=1 Tax=Mucilaginibacter gotjawali TaxID=1550579 RepID=A0A839SLM1_9SPHI|nr:hypothetical protein [Mucilaginibacter gotjawali]MBB3057419.1 hypothetical protein [Mucilaginibacter gotjawali]